MLYCMVWCTVCYGEGHDITISRYRALIVPIVRLGRFCSISGFCCKFCVDVLYLLWLKSAKFK